MMNQVQLSYTGSAFKLGENIDGQSRSLSLGLVSYEFSFGLLIEKKMLDMLDILSLEYILCHLTRF